MPRPSLGPHLYLRKRKGRAPLWVIRDKGLEIGTALVEDQRLEAEGELQQYIVDNIGVSEDTSVYIYAVSAKADNFPIKIGVTKDHRGGFGSLQNSLPYELDILGIWKVRDYSIERLLHRKFKHIRLRGEWFERTPALLSFITVAAAQAAPKTPVLGAAPEIHSFVVEESPTSILYD